MAVAIPTPVSSAPYAGNAATLANSVYAARMGNGDSASGDGYRFRGRGFMQTTGRAAYSQHSSHDCVSNPDLLPDPKIYADVAAWDWQYMQCSPLADAANWAGLTKRINGGLTNHAGRSALIQRCLATLK